MFAASARSGRGQMIYPDGSEYNGEWRDDRVSTAGIEHDVTIKFDLVSHLLSEYLTPLIYARYVKYFFLWFSQFPPFFTMFIPVRDTNDDFCL